MGPGRRCFASSRMSSTLWQDFSRRNIQVTSLDFDRENRSRHLPREAPWRGSPPELGDGANRLRFRLQKTLQCEERALTRLPNPPRFPAAPRSFAEASHFARRRYLISSAGGGVQPHASGVSRKVLRNSQ